jgi:hypothetical protein
VIHIFCEVQNPPSERAQEFQLTTCTQKLWVFKWIFTLRKAWRAHAVAVVAGRALRNIASHFHPSAKPWGWRTPLISVCKWSQAVMFLFYCNKSVYRAKAYIGTFTTR